MVGAGPGIAVVVAAHVAAGLVLVAGAAKVVRPAATRDVLALSRVPGGTGLARGLGFGEIVLALSVVAIGGRLAFAALAVAYAAFILVALHQRRAGRGCGCFGSPTSHVGPLHLAIDGVAAIVAAVAAVLVAPPLHVLLPDGAVAAAAAVVLVGTAVVLAQLSLTSLPQLLAAEAVTRPGGRR